MKISVSNILFFHIMTITPVFLPTTHTPLKLKKRCFLYKHLAEKYFVLDTTGVSGKKYKVGDKRSTKRTKETAGRDVRMLQHDLICFTDKRFIMKMHANEINICLMFYN